MSANKEQHFVASSYLKRWTHNKELLYAYDLKKRKLHENNPIKICKEGHLYSIPDSFGLEPEKKLLIEDLLCEIEGGANPMIQKIIDGKKINNEERKSLALYIAAQKIRTPHHIEDVAEFAKALVSRNISQILQSPESLKRLIGYLREKGTPEIEFIEKDPKRFLKSQLKLIELGIVDIENKREIWLTPMFKALTPLAEHYLDSTWHILRAGTRRAFITSDDPVVTFSELSEGSKKREDVKSIQIFFPLSPKVLLLIQWPGRPLIKELTSLESKDSVNEINARIIAYTQRYIFSHNKNLLLRTVERYYELWKTTRQHDQIKPALKGEVPFIELPSGMEPPYIKRTFKDSAY